MTSRIFSVVYWILLVSACASHAPTTARWGAQTPEALFQSIRQAVRDQAFDNLYALLSDSAQAEVDAVKSNLANRLAQKGEPDLLAALAVSSVSELRALRGRDFFIRMMTVPALRREEIPQYFFAVGTARFVKSERTDGGRRAQVTLRLANGRPDSARVILEDRSWKLER